MKLRIKDIVHTGNHGEPGASKIGAKYDKRRGCTFDYYPEEWGAGQHLFLGLEGYDHSGIVTTPLVNQFFSNENEYTIETENSFYICEVLEEK